jgi:hypothetical protein
MIRGSRDTTRTQAGLQAVEHQHNCQAGTNTEVADGYLDPPWRHPAAPHRRPLSQQRVVDTALALLTAKRSTRRVVQALDTGPAAQYAHLLHGSQGLAAVSDSQNAGW